MAELKCSIMKNIPILDPWQLWFSIGRSGPLGSANICEIWRPKIRILLIIKNIIFNGYSILYYISTVLLKKGQYEILMKGQTDFMHSNPLGKNGQTA